MVKFLNYKEEKLPIKLGYKALKYLRQEDKIDISQLDPTKGELDLSIFEKVLWHALVSGHQSEGKVLGLEKEQMEDVLDECFTEFTRAIPEFFPKVDKGEQGKNEEPNQENTSQEEKTKA